MNTYHTRFEPQLERYAYKVRNALNESAEQISPEIAHRLENARKIALNHRKVSQVKVAQVAAKNASVNADGSLTLGGGFGSGFKGMWAQLLAYALPIAVLVFGLVGIVNFEQQNRITDLAEIDTAMLTDELPPQAYLDKGFKAFLKHTQTVDQTKLD